MAEADLTLTFDFGLEPTETAKAFVRSVVVEVLRELIAEEGWLNAHVQQVADRATEQSLDRAVRQARLQAPGGIG